MLPVSISCNIASKLLKLTSIENNDFKKSIYFTIETLFASSILPSEFVEGFIKELMNSRPEVVYEGDNILNDAEVMVVGYCLALS